MDRAIRVRGYIVNPRFGENGDHSASGEAPLGVLVFVAFEPGRRNNSVTAAICTAWPCFTSKGVSQLDGSCVSVAGHAYDVHGSQGGVTNGGADFAGAIFAPLLLLDGKTLRTRMRDSIKHFWSRLRA
jgi:hypothetical protein